MGLTAVGFLLLGTEFTLIGRDRFQTALIQALVYVLYGCLDPAPRVSLLRTTCLVATVLVRALRRERTNGGRGRIEIERIGLCSFRRALEEQLLQPCVEAACRKSPVFRHPCPLSLHNLQRSLHYSNSANSKIMYAFENHPQQHFPAHAGLVRRMYRIKHPSGNKPVSFTPKSYAIRNGNPLSSSFLSDSLLGFD